MLKPNVVIDYSRCTHMTVAGARCRMPSATGKELCPEHEFRRLRELHKPLPPPTANWTRAPFVSFIYLEDYDAILCNLSAVADALDRHAIDERQAGTFNRICITALKTLNARQRIEKALDVTQAIRNVRFDEKGRAHAVDNSPAAPSQPPTDSAPVATAQPGSEAKSATQDASGSAGSGTISRIQAVAAEDLKHQPAVHKSTRPDITRFIATLTNRSRISKVNSNTYVVNTPKSRFSAPGRSSAVPRKWTRRASRTYILLSKMA